MADSFPALLFALVSGYADAATRDQVCARICEGACLKEAAESIGLPLWLRRLPPEAFVAPLPRLPADPDFAVRVTNHIPREPGPARQWLADLSLAVAAAGPDYALWLARHIKPGLLTDESLQMLGAWAWFSQRPGLLGHSLLRRAWTPDMSPRRGLDEFTVWRRRLRLVDALGLGLKDCWLDAGTACGLDFQPLRTVHDFLAESAAMENCLDQFADHLLTGNSFVFSVRRGPRRIACVEIGPHQTDLAMPMIVQLRGRKNRRVAPAVWQATFAWLGSQSLKARKPRSGRASGTKPSLARAELWQPYLQHLAGSDLEARMRRALVLPSRTRQAHAKPARTRGSKSDLDANARPAAPHHPLSPEKPGKG